MSAALSLAFLALVALAQDAPKPPTQPSPQPPAQPAEPAPSPPPAAPDAPSPRAAANAARRSAEESLLADLLPAALDTAGIADLAAKLGAAPDARETVRELSERYAQRLQPHLAKAGLAVRSRLGSAFAMGRGGTLQPSPGPELVALMEASIEWRRQLAAADDELLRNLLIVRTDKATHSPTLLAFLRTVARDDAPCTDPVAAVRIPALLDAAQLEPADRRRVEDGLDRWWQRTAAAIAARRAEDERVALERARLLTSWGPAWELTAAPDERAARTAQLAALDARSRSAEDALRVVVRDSGVQLLRMLPPDASVRVRDQIEALAWPELFAQEDLLAQAAAQASKGADPDLGSAMSLLIEDLARRLEPTRRDLSRRAARSEELDAVLAEADLGAPPQAAFAALAARLELMDASDRRRKLVRDTAVQLRAMARASGAPGAALLEERVAAIEAEQRSAAWMREGILDRIAELEQGGRSRVQDDGPVPPEEPANR